MSNMKAVRSRVKADIEYGPSLVYHFTDLFFVCDLRDQAAGL